MNVDQKTYDRFMAKVSKDPCGCWLWTAAKCRSSTKKPHYGLFKYKGKPQRAHRISWEIHKGPIPDKMFICHSCDTPLCVNPDHLWFGTHKDNMDDLVLKNRKKGEKNSSTKLTAENVLEIRSSSEKNTNLAKKFNVDRCTISDIKRKRTWTHI